MIKFCEYIREHTKNIIDFGTAIKKKRTEITSRCDRMLHW